jgi:3-isopropylmalate dehydrogenase
MQLNILILPGDGIGTEVTREAVKVLHKVARKFHHEPVLTEGLIGGIAIHKTGGPLPQETIDLALKADATPWVCRNSTTWRRRNGRRRAC